MNRIKTAYENAAPGSGELAAYREEFIKKLDAPQGTARSLMTVNKRRWRRAVICSGQKNKRPVLSKKTALIAAVVIIIIASVLIGPWRPGSTGSANSISEVEAISEKRSASMSRSTFMKALPAGCYAKDLSEEDLKAFFGGKDISELAPFAAGSEKQYRAYYNSDGFVFGLYFSWTFNDGSLSVSIEKGSKVPTDPMGIVKPSYKPANVNGYTVYLCRWIMPDRQGNEYIVIPNEYDLFMCDGEVLIHCFCFDSVLDDMLSLCDRLTKTHIYLNVPG